MSTKWLQPKKGEIYIMKKFLIDMAERAIKTAAQAAVAAIGTSAVLEGVNWLHILSVAGMATVLSILTSIASHNFGETGTASLVNNHEERR
jgi:hypothetical protein